MSKQITAGDIDKAKEQFSRVVKETVLEYSRRLSKRYNCRIFLKREDQQIVRSYKIRGAYNVINSMPEDYRKKGVVCASAGNHAQGVALCCNYFKIKGTIFMPKVTPLQKIQRTKGFGKSYVEIKLVGDAFDDAQKEAIEFSKTNKLSFIHPFDDIQTITGQGTIATEILKQTPLPIDYLIAPIGGGGLISGLSTYFKEKSQKTKIIGAEPLGAASMYESIKEGMPMELESIDTFVDGAAVKKPGNISFEITQRLVDKILKIPEGRICGTMLSFLQKEGIIIEPAGALSIDALKDMKDEIRGKTIVCIVSGGNFDFERLSVVKEKYLKYKGLKKYYIIEFAQRSGSLRDFLDLLGQDDDITRFEYLKKTMKERGPALVGIETKDSKNFETLNKKLEKHKIKYKDITNNDMFFDLLV